VTVPWSRFVALGDSLTEGIGDPTRAGLLGWADRLVAHLRASHPNLQYWNLARRSLTTREARDQQLDRALELNPDLASVAVGMNDILGPDFDMEIYRDDLASIVKPLRDSGATVLTGTFPATLPALRLMPRDKARKYRSRLHQASVAVRRVADAHGALCMDAPDGWRYTMSECSIDGCHPNARGHVHIAQLALDALSREAGIDPAHIGRDGCRWVSTSARHLRWLTTQGYLHKAPAWARRMSRA